MPLIFPIVFGFLFAGLYGPNRVIGCKVGISSIAKRLALNSDHGLLRRAAKAIDYSLTIEFQIFYFVWPTICWF